MERATRALLRPSSALSICSACRRKLRLTPFASIRFNSTSTSETPNQAEPLTGYYAEILKHPLSRSHPSLQVRPPSQPPAPAPAETKAASPPDLPPKHPPADPPKFDPNDPASTARIVFGSRLAGPARTASRAAASRSIAGVLVPPRPEEPDNCCMSGCVNCVWDLYQEELEDWAVAAAKAKAALRAQQGKKPKRAKPKKEVVEERAASMDDDGGGSEASWSAQFEDAGKSQDELMKNIPVGIREFMRTEKMLKKKHMEEAEAGGRRW